MVVLMSKNNSVKIGTCSRYLSKNTELDIIVQWFQNECVPWHLQLEYRDAAGPWSRRGSGGATGCSGCRISPRRLGAPHCRTGHHPKPLALPLAGQFSRQVRDATLVSLPATAVQSTPCHDGRCRREAIGDSPHPVGVRHWQMHLADSKEGRRVHGHVPGSQGHCCLRRIYKPTWGGGTRQEETQGGRDMGNLPGCLSAPNSHGDSHHHLHHPQKDCPNSTVPGAPLPVFWL